MPDLTVVMSGTGTEVGKTWLTVELALALRKRGLSVAIRKPVQSFDSGDRTTDADVLAEASGEDSLVVCPGHRRYPLAMAPPMAADALGGPPLKLGELVEELDLPETGIALIEGVGGPRSPVAHDGDTVDLARAVDADHVVLVAHAGLGTINSVLMSTSALEEFDPIVFFNRFNSGDILHVANKRWLAGVEGIDVLTAPPELLARLNLED